MSGNENDNAMAVVDVQADGDKLGIKMEPESPRNDNSSKNIGEVSTLSVNDSGESFTAFDKALESEDCEMDKTDRSVGTPEVGEEENLEESSEEKSSTAVDVSIGYVTYQCKISEESIASGLEKYENMISAERPFKCDVCGKYFKRKSHLETHSRIHLGLKPFTCHICNKSFSQNVNLLKHVNTHTGDKPYACDVCHKSFGRSDTLQEHVRIHSGDLPYTCEVCLKSFTKNSQLKTHFMIHTGAKPHKCTYCEKSFRKKNQLKVHTMIHTGYTPYRCDICDKSFYHKGNFTIHLRIHTGYKPYVCDICGRGFNHTSNLNIHRKVHTGERPHSCEICSKTFTQKGHLNKHMKVHAGKSKNPSKDYIPGNSTASIESSMNMDVTMGDDSDELLYDTGVPTLSDDTPAVTDEPALSTPGISENRAHKTTEIVTESSTPSASGGRNLAILDIPRKIKSGTTDVGNDSVSLHSTEELTLSSPIMADKPASVRTHHKASANTEKPVLNVPIISLLGKPDNLGSVKSQGTVSNSVKDIGTTGNSGVVVLNVPGST